jgi:hypothetical protein
LIGIGLILLIVFIKRRKKRKSEKKRKNEQQLNENNSMTQQTQESISTTIQTQLSTTLASSFHKSQISFSELIIEKELGEGSYGKVCLGKWNAAPVALKLCKKKGKIEEFMREIKLMMYVSIYFFHVDKILCVFCFIFIKSDNQTQRVTSTSKCCSFVWSFIGWSSTCHCHGILFWRYD